jgi:photosystem II stability/assembly factor-like uncharacterized protein
MNASVFLAATGTGLVRAARSRDRGWAVEPVLNGQPVSCLAADPAARGRIYAGTSDRVLLSTDAGLTWRPAGMSGRAVKSLAVSPVQPGTVYAGTRPAQVFVSRDGGQSWVELAGFRRIRSRRFWFSPAEPPFTAYVQGLALSPVDLGVIVAGIEFGAVVRTADGGKTWTDHRPGALRDCHVLAFHPTNGSWVYEGGGTGAGGAFSRDAGASWRQPREGLDRHYGWACAADPARPEVWYVSLSTGPAKAHGNGDARAGIFRTVAGAPWERLAGGLPQPLNHMPYALLTDQSSPGHLYAGLSSGDVWHSTDYGESWARLPFSLGSIARSMIMIC